MVDSGEASWSLSENRDVRKKRNRDIGESIANSIEEFQSLLSSKSSAQQNKPKKKRSELSSRHS